MNYDEYLNVRMDKNLKKQLMNRAKKDGTTLGKQARKALRMFIEERVIIETYKDKL